MKPICPKHNVPMTILFTSTVCDLCDPPKTQPKTNHHGYYRIKASGHDMRAGLPKTYFQGDWHIMESNINHNGKATATAILDWNGVPASYTFIFERCGIPSPVLVLNGNILFEVLDKSGGSFHVDDATVNWHLTNAQSHASSMLKSIGHRTNFDTTTLSIDLQQSIAQIFRWKKW